MRRDEQARGIRAASHRLVARTSKQADEVSLADVNDADGIWEERDHCPSDHGLASDDDSWLPGLVADDGASEPDLPLFRGSNGGAPVATHEIPTPSPELVSLRDSAETAEIAFDSDTDANSDLLSDEEHSASVLVVEMLDIHPNTAGEDEAPDLGDEDAFDVEVLSDDEWAVDVDGEIEAGSDLGLWATQDDFDLPDYDPAARIDPWDVEVSDDEDSLRRARAKAAELAGLLDLVTPTERTAALAYLSELFRQLPHGATRSALLRLGAEGLDLRTLAAMVDLRREWFTRSEWWLHRVSDRPLASEKCRAAMTWRLALHVCRNRADFPADCMIGDDWIEEWYALRPGTPGYLRFADFVADKSDPDGSATLFEGLVNAPGDHHDDPVLADDHHRLHRATVGPAPIQYAPVLRAADAIRTKDDR